MTAREIGYAVGGGILLATVVAAAQHFSSKLPFQFGEIEIGYIPSVDQHRIYIGIHYTYRGGCDTIAWTHGVTDEEGEVFTLAAYQGPGDGPDSEFVIDGEALFQSVTNRERPLAEGHYKWRGLMVCTTGVDGEERQIPMWTPIEDLFVTHAYPSGVIRSPMRGSNAAMLFTPL